jgi:hypothetical protein
VNGRSLEAALSSMFDPTSITTLGSLGWKLAQRATSCSQRVVSRGRPRASSVTNPSGGRAGVRGFGTPSSIKNRNPASLRGFKPFQKIGLAGFEPTTF